MYLPLLLCDRVCVNGNLVEFDLVQRPILRIYWHFLYRLEYIESVYQLTEYGVDVVEVWRLIIEDEELTAIRTRTATGHSEDAARIMLQTIAQLILEILTVDTVTALASAGRIA